MRLPCPAEHVCLPVTSFNRRPKRQSTELQTIKKQPHRELFFTSDKTNCLFVNHIHRDPVAKHGHVIFHRTVSSVLLGSFFLRPLVFVVPYRGRYLKGSCGSGGSRKKASMTSVIEAFFPRHTTVHSAVGVLI